MERSVQDDINEALKRIENELFQETRLPCWRCGVVFTDDSTNPGKRNVLCPEHRDKRSIELLGKIWSLTATMEELKEFQEAVWQIG